MINRSEPKRQKPAVSARIPPELHDELVKLKEATGKTESEVINEALGSYLGVATQLTVPDRVSQTEGRLAELEERVNGILGKFQSLAV